MGYDHLAIERQDGVGWLWLDRPERRNALSADMWADLPAAVADLASDPEVRALVVGGRGTDFTTGIDLAMLGTLTRQGRSPVESRRILYEEIKRLQDTMTSLARCAKPVVAAVHGYCLGAGMDLITACDIRLASAEAVFSVRETRMALVADVGTLQRLPKVIAPGHAAELIYTGRDIDAARAGEIGLVDRVLADPDALFDAAQTLGEEIAANSPLAVEGSKAMLRAGADMTTDQALDHVALWNASFLQSDDLAEALAAFGDKRPPRFTGS